MSYCSIYDDNSTDVGVTIDQNGHSFTLDDDSINLGITINEDGLLTWIPNLAASYPITIFVTDSNDNTVSQTFNLDVVERQIATVPPTITSSPTGPAYIGETWNYDLKATAENVGDIKFYLVDSDGEIINEIVDGKLELLFDDAGEQKLIIRAVDSNDAWSEQRFTITAIERVIPTNEPPVITSVPVEQIRLENNYRYKINAYDPNGESLSYKLAKSPVGASISSDGVLTWHPSQVGQYEFEILVSDGQNEVAQKFSLNVLPPITINTPPVITSVLTSGAMKDRGYVYQATASDVDGDNITWSIDTMGIPVEAIGVDGDALRIDADTGILTWTPRVAGVYTFKIIVSDGTDSVAQIITLPVANNAPPVITNLPTNTVGQVGEEYVAQILADDPNGDALTYKLENAPDGLTISDDGTITWSEPVAGRYTVAVIATDSEGATAQRQFVLQIIDTNIPNEPPQITNTPPSTIPVNKQFSFQLNTSDPENDNVAVSLEDAPDGMTITSGGRIDWTPTETGQVTFSVKISDGTNALVYTFAMEVAAQRANSKPVFTSQPPSSVLANKQFKYQPAATDPDGDSVTFTLVSAPSGMTLNQNNEIIWTPSNALIGKTVSVTISATDNYGATTEQTFELAIRSVAQPPVVTPGELPYGVVGQNYSYQVNATDPQNEKLTYSISGEAHGASIDKDTGLLTRGSRHDQKNTTKRIIRCRFRFYNGIDACAS
jgi:hypothetical protein